jgi:hypothetical protein
MTQSPREREKLVDEGWKGKKRACFGTSLRKQALMIPHSPLFHSGEEI